MRKLTGKVDKVDNCHSIPAPPHRGEGSLGGRFIKFGFHGAKKPVPAPREWREWREWRMESRAVFSPKAGKPAAPQGREPIARGSNQARRIGTHRAMLADRILQLSNNRPGGEATGDPGHSIDVASVFSEIAAGLTSAGCALSSAIFGACACQALRCCPTVS